MLGFVIGELVVSNTTGRNGIPLPTLTLDRPPRTVADDATRKRLTLVVHEYVLERVIQFRKVRNKLRTLRLTLECTDEFGGVLLCVECTKFSRYPITVYWQCWCRRIEILCPFLQCFHSDPQVCL